MVSSDEQWWDAQCGEYVLGTLRGTDREVFEKILQVDTDVQARVVYWEQRLGSLNQYLQPVAPPEHVLADILARIRSENQDLSGTDQQLATSPDDTHDLTSDWTRDLDETLGHDSQGNTTNVDTTFEQRRHVQTGTRRNTFWKSLAMLSTAATILLAAMLLKQTDQQPDSLSFPKIGSLSVVQNADQQALWLITLDDSTQLAHTVALAPPALQATQSYQLWMVLPDNGGVSSVGLLPRNAGESQLVQLPVPISEAEAFAVSLEPATGSPEDVPTGPVLFSGTIQTLGNGAL